MKFVLIFIAVATHFPPYSVTAEFDDKPACDVALKAIRETQRLTVRDEPHNAYILGECFPKASQ